MLIPEEAGLPASSRIGSVDQVELSWFGIAARNHWSNVSERKSPDVLHNIDYAIFTIRGVRATPICDSC